jgi:hypothetical protein
MKQKNASHVVDKGIEDLVVSYAFYGNSVLLNSHFLNLDQLSKLVYKKFIKMSTWKFWVLHGEQISDPVQNSAFEVLLIN